MLGMRDRLQLDTLYFQCNASHNIINRLILKYRLRFCKCSTKLEEVSKVLRGSSGASKYNYAELDKVAEDIESGSSAVPYLLRDNVLALVAEGKKADYIAMFNLSRSAVKVYADIDSFKHTDDKDGVVTEIFSDMDYLVSEGKIYIRRFPAMDCMLFARYK
jgi:hypothetical protein